MTRSLHQPPIVTERLILRDLTSADFGAVHAYASDPIVVQFMPWGPNTEIDTIDFLTRAQAGARAEPRIGYELGIEHQETGTILGAIGLHREDTSAREAMLGYCLAREAWGRGYATEAGRAILGFGFRDLVLDRIWAGCAAENEASIRVLRKLRMTLRSRRSHEDEGDSLMFRIRLDEFRERR